jgi:hypothetical protein
MLASKGEPVLAAAKINTPQYSHWLRRRLKGYTWRVRSRTPTEMEIRRKKRQHH